MGRAYMYQISDVAELNGREAVEQTGKFVFS